MTPVKFLLILSLAFALSFGEGVATDTQPEEDAYVLIVSIDGFPAWSLWDDSIPLPTIRELAQQGTYARAMIPSTPTVTWPNHTTLVTGVHPEKHGVLTNGMFVRSGAGEPIVRDPHRDKEELVAVPTLYDIAHEQGLRTAEVNWPCTRNATTLDDSFPDTPDMLRYTTPELRDELIEMGLIDESWEDGWTAGQPRRDYVWTAAAGHLIRARQPNVLLVHLLNVDGTHHQFGEGTTPGNTALALADRHVYQMVQALEDAGIRERTTIFIVSDHGFMNVTNTLHPNVLLREEGLLDVDDEGNVTGARVHIVSNGGSAMLYATDPETREQDLEAARSLFEGAEGTRVLEPSEYAEYGLPDPSDNEQMGDLVLAAGEGYGFSNAAGGEDYVVPTDQTRGYHGYPADDPRMETLFIASGRGIRVGAELDTVDNRSVAPTAAALLGITLETADGQVLDEILEHEATP